MAEELLPINNISYHFIKTCNGCISEKVIQTSIVCKNFDELLNDLKTKKEFIHKNKYSDIYITCSSLNKELYTSSYLWHTDYVNSNKIYKLSLFDIIMHTNQSSTKNPQVQESKQEVKSKETPKKDPIKQVNKTVPTKEQPTPEPKKQSTQNKSEEINTKFIKELNNLYPKMNLTDLAKILSQKLPNESTIQSPDDDIIVTNNKTGKKINSLPETKDTHPECQCFKVNTSPNENPKIEEIPFKAPNKIPENHPDANSDQHYTPDELDQLKNLIQELYQNYNPYYSDHLSPFEDPYMDYDFPVRRMLYPHRFDKIIEPAKKRRRGYPMRNPFSSYMF